MHGNCGLLLAHTRFTEALFCRSHMLDLALPGSFTKQQAFRHWLESVVTCECHLQGKISSLIASMKQLDQ